MTVYSMCVQCGHQWVNDGDNFIQKPCVKCGCKKANVDMGNGKPDWWVEEEEQP